MARRYPVLPRSLLAALVLFAVGLSDATAQGISDASCRTVMGSYRILTTQPGGTSTIQGSCKFDRPGMTMTCTNEYGDTRGTRYVTTATTRYASIDTILEEVAVVPPRIRFLGAATTTTGTGIPVTSTTVTAVYDAQNRITTLTGTQQPSGGTSTTRYTSWDRNGRPTSATIVGGGQQPVAQTFTYNDAGRSQTTVTAGATCTQTFDENANPQIATCSGTGMSTTTTTTVLSTQQICR